MANLILIDVSHVWRAAWHSNGDQHVSAAFTQTIDKVHALASGFDHVGIACDHPPYKRRDIYAEYKANREKPDEQMLEQFKRVKARLEADGFLLWSVPGFEADDLIATAVDLACREEEPLTVTIASNDKDLMQLVDDSRGVSFLSTANGERLTEAGVLAKFGVMPRRLGDALALMGDSSDNVPGIPKVGPKTAAKLLAEFGDLEGVLCNWQRVTQPALSAAIRDNAASVRLAKRLVTLCADCPIEFDAVFVRREPKPLTEESMSDETFNDDDDDAKALDEFSGSPERPSPAPERPASEPPSAPAPRPVAIERAAPAQLAQPQQFEEGLQPVDMRAAFKLACALYDSRLYARFPTKEAIFAVIIRGREMGLGAMTSLDMFHVIEGKPAPHAMLLIARAKQHQDCEYFRYVGGDHTYAEYETKNRHNPAPTKLRYTIEQAKRAGVVKSGSNWERRPEEMLRKSCAVQLARIEYPEALGGLYALEEVAA